MSLSTSFKSKRGNRGKGYDRAVRALAPKIAEYLSSNIVKQAELADALNADEVPAPNGKRWCQSVLSRFLNRAAALKLGIKPQSKSVAASGRVVNYRPTSKYGMPDA